MRSCSCSLGERRPCRAGWSSMGAGRSADVVPVVALGRVTRGRGGRRARAPAAGAGRRPCERHTRRPPSTRRPRPRRGRPPGPAPPPRPTAGAPASASHRPHRPAGQRRRRAAPAPGRRWGRRRRPGRRAGRHVVGGQARRAGQQGGDVALGDVVEQREHLVAHPVAAEARGRRCVGSSTGAGRARRTGPRVSARRRPRSGSAVAAASPAEAVEAGAPQQVAAARSRPGRRRCGR